MGNGAEDFDGDWILRTSAATLASAPIAADAPSVPDFGAQLERFACPWLVQTMTFDVGEPAQMAFVDIARRGLTPGGLLTSGIDR